ncbi:MAG: hypothetical protein LQ341_002713 [Variospora aurantia]|nr:MAG: hypothetical protein LQ341_002713 [Variospora aurantia]
MSRNISRSLKCSQATFLISRTSPARRSLSTAPPAQKSRSWKSSTIRWGLAAGAIYYYNTSPLFADNPTLLEPLLPDSPTDDTPLQTLESVARSRTSTQSKSPSAHTSAVPSVTDEPVPTATDGTVSPLDPQATQDEASQEGAFNEETGEINWDCPCLGEMAQGPCGDQFKQAFSCFVFSKEEPKGMDCIEHFKTMQGCFREHPDIYGGELDEDEVEDEIKEQQADKEGVPERSSVAKGAEIPSFNASETDPTQAVAEPPAQATGASIVGGQSEEAKTARAKEAKIRVEKEHAPLSESDELVPKAAHDARSMNEGK